MKYSFVSGGSKWSGKNRRITGRPSKEKRYCYGLFFFCWWWPARLEVTTPIQSIWCCPVAVKRRVAIVFFFSPCCWGGRAIFSRRHVCCWCRCFWRWPCRRLRPGRRRRQQIDTKQLLSAVYIHGIAADGETCGGDLLRIRRSARRPSSARAPPSL